MRDIFFEDEIEYFSETVSSILTAFLQSNHCADDTINFLHQFNADIKNGLKNKDGIISTINHLYDEILVFTKIHLAELTALEKKYNIPVDDKQKENVLKERCLAIKSDELNHLIHVLSNLVYAMQHKTQYLLQYQKELMEIEKDENQQCDSCGDSRLMLAIKRGDVTRALQFIGRSMFINRKNRLGQTPLMLAASQGFETVVKALLTHGAELDVGGPSWSTPHETALYYAIIYKHQSTANLLISAGARVHFEWKNKENKQEDVSLINLANNSGMKLIAPENNLVLLYSFVAKVIKNNLSSSKIRKWLNDHECKFETFLSAYTCVKYGSLNDDNYQKVVNEFKEKRTAELEKKYRFHFVFNTNVSVLYDLTKTVLENEENKKHQPSI